MKCNVFFMTIRHLTIGPSLGLIFLVGCATVESDYKKAVQIDTVESYTAFIKQHPQGEYTSNAKKLRLHLLFKEAQKLDTIESYNSFLNNDLVMRENNQSHFRYILEEARERITQLNFEKAKALNTVEGLEEFSHDYPTHSLATEAQQRIKELKDRERLAQAEQHYSQGLNFEKQGGWVKDANSQEIERIDPTLLTQACQEYQKASDLNVDLEGVSVALQRCHARQFLISGVKLMKVDPEAGIKEFKKGLAADPFDRADLHAEFHNNIGLAYNQMRKFELAVKAFENSEEIDPTSSAIQYNLPYNQALLYFEQNDLPQAKAAIQKAIQAAPHKAKPLVILGMIYRRLGKLEKSETTLKKATDLDPNFGEGHLQLAKTYILLNKNNKAAKSAELALEFDPDNDVVHGPLGIAYVQLGRYPEARNKLEKAIELNPKSGQLYFMLGKTYELLGEKKRATKFYEKALTFDPNSLEALTRLGRLYVEFKMPEKASENLKKAIKFNPQSIDLWELLGYAYTDLQLYEKAANSYRKAINLNDKDGFLHRQLGTLLFHLKKYPEAAQAFSQAITFAPKDWEAHLRLGLTLVMQNKYDQAWAQYETLKSGDEESANKMKEVLSAHGIYPPNAEAGTNDPSGSQANSANRDFLTDVCESKVSKDLNGQVSVDGGCNENATPGEVDVHNVAVEVAKKNLDPGTSLTVTASLPQNMPSKNEQKSSGNESESPLATASLIQKAEQGDSESQYTLGRMYYYGEGVDKNFTKAAKWYKRAAEQGYAQAQFDIGLMYAIGRGVLSDRDKSEYWFAQAAEQGHNEAKKSLNRSKARKHLYRGRKYYDRGEYEKAIEAYKEGIKIDHLGGDLHFALATSLQETGELNKAITAYQKAITLDPEEPDHYHDMGVALTKKKDYSGALEAFEKAIDLKPDTGEYYYSLGLVFTHLNRTEKAVAAYQKASSLDPKFSNTYYNLGLEYQKQGKLPEAISEMKHYLRLEPNDTQASNFLKELTQQLENPEGEGDSDQKHASEISGFLTGVCESKITKDLNGHVTVDGGCNENASPETVKVHQVTVEIAKARLKRGSSITITAGLPLNKPSKIEGRSVRENDIEEEPANRPDSQSADMQSIQKKKKEPLKMYLGQLCQDGRRYLGGCPEYDYGNSRSAPW